MEFVDRVEIITTLRGGYWLTYTTTGSVQHTMRRLRKLDKWVLGAIQGGEDKDRSLPLPVVKPIYPVQFLADEDEDLCFQSNTISGC